MGRRNRGTRSRQQKYKEQTGMKRIVHIRQGRDLQWNILKKGVYI